MASDWFIRTTDGERGPISSETLKNLALEGKVTPDTPVKKGQAGTWHRAKDVHGLFVASSKQSMPATTKPPTRAASEDDDAIAYIQPAGPTRPSPAVEVSPATKPCPFCGETILLVAKKCKHCGEFLDQGSPALPQIAASSPVSQPPDDLFAAAIDEEVLHTAPSSTGNTALPDLACPECGETIPAGDTECEHCVDFLGDESRSVSQNTAVAAETLNPTHRTIKLVAIVGSFFAIFAILMVVTMLFAKSAGAGKSMSKPSTEVSAPTGYVIHMTGESPTLTLDQYLDDVNVPLTWTTTKSLAHRFPTREEAERFMTQVRRLLTIAEVSDQVSLVVESAHSDSNASEFDSKGWYCCCFFPMLGAALGIWMAIQRGKRLRNCPACGKEVSRLASVCPKCGQPLQ